MRCAGMTWHRQTGMKRVCPNWHDMASKYVHSDACVQAVNNDVRIQSLVCVCVCQKHGHPYYGNNPADTHTHTKQKTNKQKGTQHHNQKFCQTTHTQTDKRNTKHSSLTNTPKASQQKP